MMTLTPEKFDEVFGYNLKEFIESRLLQNGSTPFTKNPLKDLELQTQEGTIWITWERFLDMFGDFQDDIIVKFDTYDHELAMKIRL